MTVFSLSHCENIEQSNIQSADVILKLLLQLLTSEITDQKIDLVMVQRRRRSGAEDAFAPFKIW